MQNSEFEKSVQRQMKELKIPPGTGVWNEIEAKLPAPKKTPLLALLFLFAYSPPVSLYTLKQNPGKMLARA